MTLQVLDVLDAAGGEVVDDEDTTSLREKALGEMTSDEAGAAGDQVGQAGMLARCLAFGNGPERGLGPGLSGREPAAKLRPSMSPHETVAAFLSTRFYPSIRGGELGLDQPLLSSGIVDSFGLLELIAFLEDTFHVTIDPSRVEMTELETVNHIVALVERVSQGAGGR